MSVQKSDLRPDEWLRNLKSGCVGKVLPDPRNQLALNDCAPEFVVVLVMVEQAFQYHRVAFWSLANVEKISDPTKPKPNKKK